MTKARSRHSLGKEGVMVETWKQIQRFPLHEFSSLGRVRNIRTRRILKPWLNKDTGYPVIKVSPGNKNAYVHQLICEAFHGPRPPGKWAAHNNGIRVDCRETNLRWDTPSGNHLDKHAHGTMSVQRGEASHWAKLTRKQVIWARKSSLSSRAAGKVLGVTHAAIGSIRRGKTWAHVKMY